MVMANLNVWLAWAVLLLAAGTIDRMNGTTGWPVRLSILVIIAAMLGQGLGPLMEKWDFYIDTLLYSGLAAFLIACRRNPMGIPPPWNARLSLFVSVLATGYVLLAFSWAGV